MDQDGYTIVFDMDQTLIESVFPNDKRYKKCKGKILSYTDEDGKVTFKVNIRPYAPHLVKTVKKHNLKYVIWSAGVYDYVHTVMNYFTEVCMIKPDLIYTRSDMVSIGQYKFKSLSSKNFDSDYVIIIEDHPEFVDPKERKNVISVTSWEYENKDDVELQWVSDIITTYGIVNSLYKQDVCDFVYYGDACYSPHELKA